MSTDLVSSCFYRHSISNFKDFTVCMNTGNALWFLGQQWSKGR